MDFLIDTFSWKKLDLLKENGIINIGKLYERINLCITHEILKEINYFKIKSLDQEKTKVFPIKANSLYNEAIEMKFDLADASLICNGSKEGEIVIVSEDQPLIILAKTHRLQIIQLVDFFRILATMDIIEKRDLYRISHFLRDLRNISIKKEKEIKKWLERY